MKDQPDRLPLPVRAALRAFPPRFRAQFGADMERTYLDWRAAWQAAGRPTRMRAAAFQLRAVLELLRRGWLERLRPSWPARPAIAPKRSRGGGFMDRWLQDFRFAVRSLARRPGFTSLAVFTLALGMGANTAVFSVINAVLLRPLPYADPDGLVMVWAHATSNPDARGDMSLADLEDASALPAFASLVGQRASTAVITRSGDPEVIPTGRVTSGLLHTFHLTPLLGRDIAEADNETGSGLVVVLGYRFWRDRMGGRSDVLGATLDLSGGSYEVVGVAPEGFAFPDQAQLWVARRVPEACGRGCHTLYTIGRLAPGATVEMANAQLEGLAGRLAAAYPQSNLGTGFRAVRLADDQVADVRGALLFILGAVGLVLLIACANVANLLLVRSETRRNEVAVRSALGASGGRLAVPVLMESALLSAAGTVLGLLLAGAAVLLLRRMPAGLVPHSEQTGLDGTVLLFTLAISTVVTLLFGGAPALGLARRSLAAGLVSTQRAGDGVRARRSRSILLAGEVALSLVLLAGAGLVLKSFDRMYRVRLGFEPQELTRFQLALNLARYRSLDAGAALFQTLEQRLAALPGVVSVGSIYGPPLTPVNISGEILVQGRPEPEPGHMLFASMHAVTPGYAATAGMPLLRGRWIEATNGSASSPVAVISQAFSNRVFGTQDPLGQRFRVTADFGYGSPVWTVVGVAGDVKRGVRREPESEVYVPLPQFGPLALHVLLRTRARMAPDGAAIRNLVRSLDPGLPVRDLETVDAAVAREVAPTRFYLVALGSFAAIALVLASVGLYGVVAWIVSRRTREIGLRMALGARHSQVTGMMLRQGMAPAAAGLLAGLALTLALGRVARSMLFQVSPWDPPIIAGVTALSAMVALLAVLLPARRASRVDPVRALTTD